MRTVPSVLLPEQLDGSVVQRITWRIYNQQDTFRLVGTLRNDQVRVTLVRGPGYLRKLTATLPRINWSLGFTAAGLVTAENCIEAYTAHSH